MFVVENIDMTLEIKFPQLDADTANAVNSFSLQELCSERAFLGEKDKYESFRNNAIGKAPDFAIHAATLKIVEEYRRQGRLAEWIEEFEVSFPANRKEDEEDYRGEQPLIPFATFERMGLFIPRARKESTGDFGTEYQIGYGTSQATALFNSHIGGYANRDFDSHAIDAYGTKIQYPSVITDRHWTPYDFDNEELIKLARTKFIPDIWHGLQRYEERQQKSDDPAINELAAKLRAYYLQVSDMCSAD